MIFGADDIIPRVEENLRSARSGEEALLAGIQAFCSSCEVPYGEVWTCYAERPVLYLRDAWSPPEVELTDFVSASRKLALAPGVGLPGRVWQSRQQEVIDDLRLFPEFSRQTIALAAGFRSAVGSPVLCGGDVIAVLVCMTFIKEPQLPNLFEKMAVLVGERISERWPDSLPLRSGGSETLAYLAA